MTIDQSDISAGVCVSGGPDSMALAYLLKHVPELDRELRIEPVAFIVNHNARPESGAEASFVRKSLLDHGKPKQNPFTNLSSLPTRHRKSDTAHAVAAGL